MDNKTTKGCQAFRKKHNLFFPVFIAVMFGAAFAIVSIRHFLLEKASYSRFHIYQNKNAS